MYATLKTILALAATVVALPTPGLSPEGNNGAVNQPIEGCFQNSMRNLSWVITNINHLETWLDQSLAPGAMDLAPVKFNVTSAALVNEITACTAYSSPDSGSVTGAMTKYNCTVIPSGIFTKDTKSSTQEIISFTSSMNLDGTGTGTLNWTQSWICRDADPEYPTVFHGWGSTDLKSESCAPVGSAIGFDILDMCPDKSRNVGAYMLSATG